MLLGVRFNNQAGFARFNLRGLRPLRASRYPQKGNMKR
nr:MAG TPA: hypothetical protein [Caudoviricetes sp.]